MIVRTSDHGELGLSHGGLRQKMFNAYEESIRVPLVVSSPALFPAPRESDALVSLVDLVPTLLGLAGEPDATRRASTATTSGPVLRGERDGVRDAVLFTYDDHQAGTAFQEAPGPAEPDPLRARRAAGSTRSTSTRTARRRPSTSCTTSRPTPTRRSTSSTSAPAPGGRRRRGARRGACTSVLERLCAASGTTSPRLPPAPDDGAWVPGRLR